MSEIKIGWVEEGGRDNDNVFVGWGRLMGGLCVLGNRIWWTGRRGVILPLAKSS